MWLLLDQSRNIQISWRAWVKLYYSPRQLLVRLLLHLFQCYYLFLWYWIFFVALIVKIFRLVFHALLCFYEEGHFPFRFLSIKIMFFHIIFLSTIQASSLVKIIFCPSTSSVISPYNLLPYHVSPSLTLLANLLFASTILHIQCLCCLQCIKYVLLPNIGQIPQRYFTSLYY